jgi:hypothetical protein
MNEILSYWNIYRGKGYDFANNIDKHIVFLLSLVPIGPVVSEKKLEM